LEYLFYDTLIHYEYIPLNLRGSILKKHIISVGLFVAMLLIVLLMFRYAGTLIDGITRAMPGREGRFLIGLIVSSPIIVGYFLIKFIKKKYEEKDE